MRWLFVAAILTILCLLLWGAGLIIASEPAPSHVDSAVVLQGSITAEQARITGAIDLLRQGVAERVLLAVPRESYWGQSIPPVARSYLERKYGSNLAARVDFCETSGDVNSTRQEVEAMLPCVREHHWQSLVIVTSDYHTRRAGMLWRRMTKQEPNLHVWIEGVADPEFQRPWWRHRQSAKIWVMEFSKLVWSMFGG